MQVNGGDAAAKVEFAESLFEKEIPVDLVVNQNEMIDTIAVTKGRGTKARRLRCAISASSVERAYLLLVPQPQNVFFVNSQPIARMWQSLSWRWCGLLVRICGRVPSRWFRSIRCDQARLRRSCCNISCGIGAVADTG